MEKRRRCSPIRDLDPKSAIPRQGSANLPQDRWSCGRDQRSFRRGLEQVGSSEFLRLGHWPPEFAPDHFKFVLEKPKFVLERLKNELRRFKFDLTPLRNVIEKLKFDLEELRNVLQRLKFVLAPVEKVLEEPKFVLEAGSRERLSRHVRAPWRTQVFERSPQRR